MIATISARSFAPPTQWQVARDRRRRRTIDSKSRHGRPAHKGKQRSRKGTRWSRQPCRRFTSNRAGPRAGCRHPQVPARREWPAPAPAVIAQAPRGASVVVAMQTSHTSRKALLVHSAKGAMTSSMAIAQEVMHAVLVEAMPASTRPRCPVRGVNNVLQAHCASFPLCSKCPR